MPINREVVSELITDIQSLNADAWVSRRYVLHKLKQVALTLVKQDSDNRRLHSLTHLFTPINYMPLESASSGDMATGIIVPNNRLEHFQVSSDELPSFYDSIYGPMLQVYSIDRKIKYEFMMPSKFRADQKMRFKNRTIRHFWVENGKLVVPYPGVEAVFVLGFFVHPEQAQSLDAQYRNVSDPNRCKSLLDMTFLVPQYLMGAVQKAVFEQLVYTYGRLTPDEFINGNRTQRNVEQSRKHGEGTTM